MSLQFTRFDIDHTCVDDYLVIMDGDGSVLMEKKCGSILPPAMISTSNEIELHFITSDDHHHYQSGRSGWSVSWGAITSGTYFSATGQYVAQGQKILQGIAKAVQYSAQCPSCSVGCSSSKNPPVVTTGG